MIKAVIFDMDDTLFEEKDYVKSGFLAVDNYLTKQGITGFLEKALLLFHQKHRGTIFNKVLDELNVPYNKEYIMNLVDVYRNHVPSIQLFTEADQVLQELRPFYKLGLITDGYLNAQQNKAKALKLDQKLDFLVFTDVFGREHWKPSETPYRAVMEHFKFEPHEFVYIGDNLLKDFVTAKKLGWKTIFIKRISGEYAGEKAEEEYKAHYTVSSLKEIHVILEQLSNNPAFFINQ